MGAYCVVGGAGFVGGNLVQRLVTEGHTVRVLDVVPPDAAFRLKGIDHDYRWQSTLDFHADDIEGMGAVIYLAAQADVPLGITSPSYTFQQNVMSTVRYFDELRRWKEAGHRVPRTIYMSSESVYGVVPKVLQPITEEAPLNPTNAYAVSKMCAEAVARAYATQYDLPLTVLRSTTLYGPASRTKQVVPIFIRQALAHKDITVEGDGSQTRDFNFVFNMVHGILLALDRELDGTFNIASGREVSIKELAELVIDAVKKVSDTTSEVVFGPWRPGEKGVQLNISMKKAQNRLGYNPLYTLDSGLAQTVEWWAAHQ
jgi:nucleoside-diphosphate-sugar epimerase